MPVEAQACGRPVIAHGAGGALESIERDVSGRFFSEQTVESLVDALRRFDSGAFQTEEIRRHAERFSVQRFQAEIGQFVQRVVSTSRHAER